jgi:hypothetical protein
MNLAEQFLLRSLRTRTWSGRAVHGPVQNRVAYLCIGEATSHPSSQRKTRRTELYTLRGLALAGAFQP